MGNIACMASSIPMYQIDAFTDRMFSGNPAAVCPLDSWLPDETMQSIAMENNLSETAVFVKRNDGDFDLRWFTPTTEVDLCGHATLASAHVVLYELEPDRAEVSSTPAAENSAWNAMATNLRWTSHRSRRSGSTTLSCLAKSPRPLARRRQSSSSAHT